MTRTSAAIIVAAVAIVGGLGIYLSRRGASPVTGAGGALARAGEIRGAGYRFRETGCQGRGQCRDVTMQGGRQRRLGRSNRRGGRRIWIMLILIHLALTMTKQVRRIRWRVAR